MAQKTKIENGARTPEVIYNEVKKTFSLVAVYTDIGGLLYHYYVNEDLTNKGVEIIFRDDKPISVRQLSLEELGYLATCNQPVIKSHEFNFGGF